MWRQRSESFITVPAQAQHRCRAFLSPPHLPRSCLSRGRRSDRASDRSAPGFTWVKEGFGARILSLAVSWTPVVPSSLTISSERTDAPGPGMARSHAWAPSFSVPELLLRQAPATRVLRNRPWYPTGHQHTQVSLTWLHPLGANLGGD